jgi:hypothetical protein
VTGDVAGALEDLLAEITAFSLIPPSAEVEAAHLSAMTGLAREIARLADGASRPPIMASARPAGLPAHRRLAMGLVAPVVATPLCVVAIALAGVSLPGAVRAPLEAAGISLPNQSRGGEAETLTARAPSHHWSAPQVAHRATWAMKHTSVASPAGDDRLRPGATRGAKRGGADLVAAVGSGAAEAAGPPAWAGPPSSPEPRSPQPPAGPPPGPSGAGGPAPTPAVNTGAQGQGGGTPSSGGVAKPSIGITAHPATQSPAGTPGAGVSLPIRPGEGCGDLNHLHVRVGDCN